MTPKRAVQPLPFPSPHCRPCAGMKTGGIYRGRGTVRVLQCRCSDCSREELRPNLVCSSKAHLVAFSAGADLGGRRASVLHLSCLSGALPLPPDGEDRSFVDHETAQDPDVVRASCCALALLLAVRSSPAEWPDHIYYTALVARREGTSSSLNSKTRHGSRFQCFYVERSLEDSTFLQ